jgi:hypothetical protein
MGIGPEILLLQSSKSGPAGRAPAERRAARAVTVWRLLLIGVLVAAPPAGAASSAVQDPPADHEVRFTHGAVTLAGTLTLPADRGLHPAVVLVSGSGPQDRDETIPGVPGYAPFRWIADHLGRREMAVLRYDDRGVGNSTGTFETATSADLAGDAGAGAQIAAAQGEQRRTLDLRLLPTLTDWLAEYVTTPVRAADARARD